MAKISRACLGALLLACIALPVLSAEQRNAATQGARAAAPAPKADASQRPASTQRVDELGEALRRIQQEGKARETARQPAAAAVPAAAPKAAADPDALVSVRVSRDLEASSAFQDLMKTLPHVIMNAGANAQDGSDLLIKRGDAAKLQRDLDSRPQDRHTRKLDELAASLESVQAAQVDLGLGAVSIDAQYDAPAAEPAPTPAQVDAQALGGAAPAPADAPAAPAETPGVFGAAPAGNPSPPAEPAPAAETPAEAPAAPADAPADPAAPADPNAPADPTAPAPGAEAATPPAPREEAPAPVDSTESNAEIGAKMREIEDKGAEAIAEEGVSNANGKNKPANGTKVANVAAKAATPAYTGDPLQQRVNLDFREMELSNVVALLAAKAGINVIAGTDLAGTVTANLRNVPLQQAIETALRMNGLGMVEEEGIYRIIPYEEAQASQRINQLINLKNAKAGEIQKVIEEIVKGSPDERFISLSANQTSNVLVISGPADRVPELVAMANQLDIAKPVLPTVTEAIKLNYAEPKDVLPTVTAMLSKDVGKVAVDDRARHLVVTDVPVNVATIQDMVKTLDAPTKTVAVEAMIVDVLLTDDSETGVDWVINLLRSQSRRSAAPGGDGRFVGDLQQLAFDSALPGAAEASTLTFGLLTGDIDWTGFVKAELRNFNGKLVSSPSVLTVENKPATITIAEEIPYIELIQTAAGGQQNKTSFKEVGTILEVTPRVTHDDYIISQLSVKESNTSGTFNNVPIENKRELSTSLRMGNGQTVFMGGLRKNGDEHTVRKVPVLGDIPVVNYMFRNNKKIDRKNELVVFITCNVVEDQQELSPYHQDKLDSTSSPDLEVNGGNELFERTVHPGDLREPVWKYRRTSR